MKKICAIAVLLLSIQCTDFIQVDPPRNSLIKTTVFSSDATAEAAMTDVYYQLRSSIFGSGNILSLSFVTTMMCDENENYYNDGTAPSIEYQQFNDNNLIANNSILMYLWSDTYNLIYKCNAILEGLNSSTSITPELKKQLEGEARFVRAFCYFYITNLWGDVPYTTTSDYQLNSSIERTPQKKIYQALEEDLIQISNLLPADYTPFKGERVRATRWAAKALLARTYLYDEKWSEAEKIADEVITNNSLFKLATLSTAFTKNNTEAIFQLWTNTRPSEYTLFNFSQTPSFLALRSNFVSSFENGDSRKTTWIGSVSQYFRVTKYNDPASNPPAQYSTPIRLAELILIRAEARLRQKNVSGCVSDLNTIRARASLTPLTSSDEGTVLNLLLQERKSELFAEWGHRWFDLKRMNKSMEILSPIKPGFKATSTLMPIPEQELRNNPELLPQNQGY